VTDRNIHLPISNYPSITGLVQNDPAFFKVSLLKLKLPVFIRIKPLGKARLMAYVSFSIQDPSPGRNDWQKEEPRVIRINQNLFSNNLFLSLVAE
jgi:hypothetical protein